MQNKRANYLAIGYLKENSALVCSALLQRLQQGSGGVPGILGDTPWGALE